MGISEQYIKFRIKQICNLRDESLAEKDFIGAVYWMGYLHALYDILELVKGSEEDEG